MSGPPVSLQARGDGWFVMISPEGSERELIPLSINGSDTLKIENDVWIDWEFDINLSPTEKGYLEVKCDGVTVFRREGKNIPRRIIIISKLGYINQTGGQKTRTTLIGTSAKQTRARPH